MGSFTAPTVLGANRKDRLKCVTLTVVGATSYATGGDTLDLSQAALGKANGFAKRVDGIQLIGTSAAANTKYLPCYVPATAGAPATGLVKIHDITAASDAEVVSTTSLAGVTFTFVAFGE